ncbi:MAG TPA: FtsQ-type POTRA domain-containing protein [Candidatus Cloacimonadota bacterium]|nr:FtsQ-type POTRA domain-containing protein [Candidatus Cloacimonadota bacterium]HOV16579.1 FtsQ-type POTRA domain-containing protein [Candidatus Cloacimonadota bacterium]HQL15227.1 FtsQ-type POTRA domain-containing protein [Candidatus Cloacimonadota bacterium]
MIEKGRKRRGNSRFIVYFSLILILLSVAGIFGYRTLCKADWLNIQNIEIIGNENISSQTLRTILQPYAETNLLALSSHEVKDDLYKIKRIADIKVIKLFPSTLKVKITERKGFLYLLSREGDLFPVDEQGMVIEYSFSPSQEDLPIVHTSYSSKQLHAGKIVKDNFLNRVYALQKQIISEQPDFVKSVSEYYKQGDLIVIIDARYGTRIILGDQNIKDQLRRYQFVRENSSIERDKILDLRFKDQIIVRREVE